MGSSGRFEALIGMGVVVWLAAVAVAAPPLEAVEGLFDASRPRTLGLSGLQLTETVLYRATETPFRFCHHPNLVKREKMVWCMWSNGRVGEDEPGQRILYSTARVGALDRWSTPRELAKDPSGLCGGGLGRFGKNTGCFLHDHRRDEFRSENRVVGEDIDGWPDMVGVPTSGARVLHRATDRRARRRPVAGR